MANKSSMQPTSGHALKDSFRAEGGALTRGYGVIAGTAEDQVKACSADAQRCVGVMDESVAQDKLGSVVIFGPAIAVAGGAISRLDRVKVANGGKFVAGNAADVETVGYAVNAAAGDGDEFVLFVQPIHKRS